MNRPLTSAASPALEPARADARCAGISRFAALRRHARLVLGIFKLRIGVLIMVTALAGMAAVPGSSALTLSQVLALALAVLLSSAAAGAFNQFAEADTDRLMPRTRGRAFASVALLIAAVAACAWLVNVWAALFTAAGALTYGLVYTLWLKRRTAWNIVIGGAAGSFAVLAGAAAVSPELSPMAWVLALVLLLWTPPHFWSLAIANEAEYAAAGVPMLPVVVGVPKAAQIVHRQALLLVAVSLVPLAFGAGWVYGLGAAAGGLHFLRKTHALARWPERRNAIAAFLASMVQLSVLLAAVVVDAALR
jgi:protoheme IX farnesyltransferase